MFTLRNIAGVHINPSDLLKMPGVTVTAREFCVRRLPDVLVQRRLSPAARDRAIVLLHAVWNVGRFIMTLLWILVPPTQHWTAYLLVGAASPALL